MERDQINVSRLIVCIKDGQTKENGIDSQQQRVPLVFFSVDLIMYVKLQIHLTVSAHAKKRFFIWLFPIPKLSCVISIIFFVIGLLISPQHTRF